MYAATARTITDSAGSSVEVRITPRETPRGLSSHANSLVFEHSDGQWIGALPVRRSLSLRDWSDDELLVLAREARRWL